MLKLARGYVRLVVDEITADYLLSDHDYHFLSSNAEARAQLLDFLGVDSILISNMGSEVEPKSLYISDVRDVIPPVIDYNREVGYHHKLDGN